jgi:hypothetical protein
MYTNTALLTFSFAYRHSSSGYLLRICSTLSCHALSPPGLSLALHAVWVSILFSIGWLQKDKCKHAAKAPTVKVAICTSVYHSGSSACICAPTCLCTPHVTSIFAQWQKDNGLSMFLSCNWGGAATMRRCVCAEYGTFSLIFCEVG